MGVYCTYKIRDGGAFFAYYFRFSNPSAPVKLNIISESIALHLNNKNKTMEGHTNWIALIAAAIATQIIGFIWYNPKVFGSAWMASTGIANEDAKKSNMAVIG